MNLIKKMIKKKTSSIDEYDYENESQSSTSKQQQYSTSRQLTTPEVTLSMSPNTPGTPYIALRIDVNDKSVSIKQPRTIEKKKRSKNESFSSNFSKRSRLF